MIVLLLNNIIAGDVIYNVRTTLCSVKMKDLKVEKKSTELTFTN